MTVHSPKAEIRRILSRPADVWWAGWRSTTYELQDAGWQIAAEEDVERGHIRLVMRHEAMRMHALTDFTKFDYFNGSGLTATEVYEGMYRRLLFNVVHVVPRIEVMRVSGFDDFRAIDARPQMVESSIRSIEDMRIFVSPLVRTEEIIVEPQDVAAMLEQIRKMQVPEQERIRAKQRLAARREDMNIDAAPMQTFHAQVISIGDYKKTGTR